MKLKDYTNAINPIIGILIIVVITTIFFSITTINDQLEKENDLVEAFSDHIKVDFDNMVISYQETLQKVLKEDRFKALFIEDKNTLKLNSDVDYNKVNDTFYSLLRYNEALLDIYLKDTINNAYLSLVNYEQTISYDTLLTQSKWQENTSGFVRFGFNEVNHALIIEVPVLYNQKSTGYVLSMMLDISPVFYNQVNEAYEVDIVNHKAESFVMKDNDVIKSIYADYGEGVFDVPSPFDRNKSTMYLKELSYYKKHVIASRILNEHYTLIVTKAYNKFNIAAGTHNIFNHFVSISILILSLVGLLVYSNQRTKIWVENDKQFLNEIIEMDKVNLSEVNRELRFYSDFFMESPIPILVIDKESLRLVKANLQALKFYGYQEQELVNLHLTDICKWEDEQSESMLVNVQHITKDNHVLDQMVRIQDVLFNEDEMLVMLIIGSPAMDVNKVESMKMEMFHEIRSPLQGAVGAVDKIEKATDGYGEYIGIIKRSINTVLNMTNSMLAENKSNQRKNKLFLSEFDLVPLVDEVVSLSVYQDLHYNIIASNINLVRNHTLIPTQHYFMQSDSVKIRQILVNLMSNAIKYTQNGMINLTVEIIEKDQLDVIVFRVADSGVGLTKEQIDHLYDAYETFGNPEEDVIQTGLGMTITKKYVEMLGSELHVSSEYGIGSTFSFSLEVPKLKENTTSNKQFSILVVDDDEVSLQLIDQLLKKEKSYFVRTLSLETDLLSELNRHNYDLLIIDENLNHFKGSDLRILIRHSFNKRLSDIPIIMMTASLVDDESLDEMTSYIQKPFEEEQLFKLIERLIQSHKQMNFIIDPNIINDVKLHDTIEGVGFDVFKELVYKFENNSKEEIHAIKQLLANDDYEQTKILLHRLKGSMSYFAPVIAMDLIVNMELMAKVSDENLIYEVPVLENALNQLYEALRSIIKETEDH